MDEKYYFDNLYKYARAIDLCIKISKLAEGRKTENKIFWASVLYTKMCVTGVSIRILSPESDFIKKDFLHWDYASLYSLTRNLMECYHALFYLCVDNVDADELIARKKLFNLHDYYSRKKLFSYTDEPIEDTEIEKSVIEELCETKYFKNLSSKQQKHYLKGEDAYFISREDIEVKIGTDKQYFKYVYKLFSSNTHSFPMGFYGMIKGDIGRGTRTDKEMYYNGYALEIAEQYITQASRDMLKFFPDILNHLTATDKISINYIF